MTFAWIGQGRRRREAEEPRSSTRPDPLREREQGEREEEGEGRVEQRDPPEHHRVSAERDRERGDVGDPPPYRVRANSNVTSTVPTLKATDTSRAAMSLTPKKKYDDRDELLVQEEVRVAPGGEDEVPAQLVVARQDPGLPGVDGLVASEARAIRYQRRGSAAMTMMPSRSQAPRSREVRLASPRIRSSPLGISVDNLSMRVSRNATIAPVLHCVASVRYRCSLSHLPRPEGLRLTSTARRRTARSFHSLDPESLPMRD